MKENNEEVVFKIAAVDQNNKVQEVYVRYFNAKHDEKKYNPNWRYVLLNHLDNVKSGDFLDAFGCEKLLGGCYE